MDIPHLELKLSHTLKANQLQLINTLKFQNQLYQPGDNLKLRSDINNSLNTKDLFGKILLIVQAKPITPFPLLLIAWYEPLHPQLHPSIQKYDLSPKQLILTQSTDWQYIQAVKGKIQVIPELQFRTLNPKQQQHPNLFYCRSYLTQNHQFIIDSQKHCYCQNIYTPQKPLSKCQLCHVLFHVGCAASKEEKCGKCII